MNEPLYLAQSRIEMLGSLHRRAHIALGHQLEFGVHGPVRDHYRLESLRDRRSSLLRLRASRRQSGNEAEPPHPAGG